MSTIQTNSITDAAGTGAPDFPNGIEVATGQNIVIGTDSGDPFNGNSRIRVQGTGDEWIQIKSDGTGVVGLLFGDTTDDFTAGIQSDQTASASMLFFANNAERMRIDSSGNVSVATTGSDVVSGTNAGAVIRNDGRIDAGVSGACSILNRIGTTGNAVLFRYEGTTIGYIGVGASNLYIGSGDVTLAFSSSGDAIVPAGTDGATRSGAIDLGNSANRWDTVFATVGTINTSDRTEKQDIEELNDAERRVAVACKGLLRKYRLKSAVALKGEDARIHFGIIAQDLQAAFEAEGLDAGRYGMFINSTWTDEQTGEEKSLMGVRYSELLAFMIAVL